MKIKSLWISEYKNICDKKITFGDNVITLMVGQNGLGKSNLIEILAFIFKDLLTISRKSDFADVNNRSASFYYILDYECNGAIIKIIDTPEDSQILVRYRGRSIVEHISFTEFRRKSKELLPARIVGYYSGENRRLENMLAPYINSERAKQTRAYDKDKEDRRLRDIFFFENQHSRLILFTMYIYWHHPLYGESINKLFETLKIEELIDFEISFANPVFSNLKILEDNDKTLEHYTGEILTDGDFNRFTDVDIFWGIKGVVDPLLRLFLITYLGESGSAIYQENGREYFNIHDISLDGTLIDNIHKLFETPLDFFDAIETCSNIGALYDLKMNIGKIGDREVFEFDSLSEGEQQLISVLGLMAISKDDNDEVLYLIDEPDTHINPLWQRNFVQMLKDNISDPHSRQVFISTHSPLLVQAYDENVGILLFKKDDDDNVMIETKTHTVPNWKVGQVLMSEYFDLPSSRPASIDELMNLRTSLIEKGELTVEEEALLKEYENELGFLPTGETISEIKSMAYIFDVARKLQEREEGEK